MSRIYSNLALPTTLAGGGITSVATSITLTDASTWPSPLFGQTAVVALDYGRSTMELVEYESRSGNVITLSSAAMRGRDGTTARNHAAGVKAYHVRSAFDGRLNLAYVSGLYYRYPLSPTVSAAALANGENNAVPWEFPMGVLVDQVFIDVTVVGGAGALYRAAIYADGGGGYPDDLIIDLGTQDTNVSTGIKTWTPGSPVDVGGLIFLAGATQGAPTPAATIRTFNQSINFPFGFSAAATALAGNQQCGFRGAATTGAFAANFTASRAVTGGAPLFGVRIA